MMHASSDYRQQSQHNYSDQRSQDSSDENNRGEVVDWSMSNQNNPNSNNDHMIDIDKGQ